MTHFISDFTVREGAKNTPKGVVCKIWGGGRLHLQKFLGGVDQLGKFLGGEETEDPKKWVGVGDG